VVAVQVMMLALLPVVLYLLGASLHSRLAGLLAGVFFIFQEHNAITLSGVINVSHSKLLMSDVPAALILCLFSLLVAVWVRRGGRGAIVALLAGGALGAALLVRPQALVLLPAVALVMIVSQIRTPRMWMKGCALLAAGMLLCVLPWVWRNWQIYGGFVFDEPSSAQIGMVAQRYTVSLTEGELSPAVSGETGEEYSSRMTGHILSFLVSHPQEVLRFSAAHFMHNMVNLATVMPLAPDTIDAETYVRQQRYWLDPSENPGTRPPFEDKFCLLLSLLLLGIGVGSAAGQAGLGRWAGLTPFVVYLAYNLSNALARNSGWRFMLPGDWAGWLYLGVGVSQVLVWGALIFSPGDADLPWLVQTISGSAPGRVREGGALKPVRVALPVAVTAGLIVLFGAAIPISEALIPRRYAHLTAQEALAAMRRLELPPQQRAELDVLDRLVDDGKAVVVWGRALYPRFYRSGRGITAGSPSPLTAPLAYNRLTFRLVGEQRVDVVLPLEKPPADFPNAADAFAVGCLADNYLSAFQVVVLNSRQPSKPHVYEQDLAGKVLCP